MYELKKNVGKVFTSKFVGTGSSSYKKRIYRAAASQRLKNTGLDRPRGPLSHLCNGYLGYFAKVKLPKPGVDHPPHLASRVKKE